MGGRLGNLVAFYRHRDLWVTTFDGVEQQLTLSPSSTIFNGVAEYVMQEEFHRFTGYWWEPVLEGDDAEPTKPERILCMEVDESAVELISIPRPGIDGGVDKYRYPRVGKANALAAPKIVEFFPKYSEAPYLFECSVWAQLLDRKQQHTAVIRIPDKLFMTFDEYRSCTPSETSMEPVIPKTFPKVEVLYEETSPFWINVTDIPQFLPSSIPGQTRFIWASERTGFRHLCIITAQPADQLSIIPFIPTSPGTPTSSITHPPITIRQITSGEWQVVDHPIWVDQSRSLVYFMAKRDTPLETHLYVASFDEQHTAPVAPMPFRGPLQLHRLTELGRSHTVKMDAGCTRFVTVCSSVAERPRTEVYFLDFEHGSDGMPSRGVGEGLGSGEEYHKRLPRARSAMSLDTPEDVVVSSEPVDTDMGTETEFDGDYAGRTEKAPLPFPRASFLTSLKPKEEAAGGELVQAQAPVPEMFSFVNSDGVCYLQSRTLGAFDRGPRLTFER
ncbi:dipeptidylpeptidase [Borealophlyctis nickersoniae]|nr:dipeptidylpeptidase [Borealophlyctis nickersoniae]